MRGAEAAAVAAVASAPPPQQQDDDDDDDDEQARRTREARERGMSAREIGSERKSSMGSDPGGGAADAL